MTRSGASDRVINKRNVKQRMSLLMRLRLVAFGGKIYMFISDIEARFIRAFLLFFGIYIVYTKCVTVSYCVHFRR